MAEFGSFGNSVRRFFRDYVAGMDARSPFGELVVRAMRDPAERERLVTAPKEALAEAGVKLPADLEVEILQNTETVIHLVLPPFVGSEAGEGAGQ